eukprot:693078-Pyramimonas_sp.AAC.1
MAACARMVSDCCRRIPACARSAIACTPQHLAERPFRPPTPTLGTSAFGRLRPSCTVQHTLKMPPVFLTFSRLLRLKGV